MQVQPQGAVDDMVIGSYCTVVREEGRVKIGTPEGKEGPPPPQKTEGRVLFSSHPPHLCFSPHPLPAHAVSLRPSLLSLPSIHSFIHSFTHSLTLFCLVVAHLSTRINTGCLHYLPPSRNKDNCLHSFAYHLSTIHFPHDLIQS
jgi:hypothetical protein